jgi:creatinine amidohydrolase
MTLFASLTTREVEVWLRRSPTAILLSVGSVEPHGPHLPLSTDSLINSSAIARGSKRLQDVGIATLVAPDVPYGVTDFAQGFAGAVSMTRETLVRYVSEVCQGFLSAGVSCVCLVSNHLEPGHYAALQEVAQKDARIALASPLSRRWARQLGPEFRKGECHAGAYETSIVLVDHETLVRPTYAALPAVPVSLSDGIKAGQHTFVAMGMNDAYAGAPALATASEGETWLSVLAEMIESEVRETLARAE